MNPTEESYWNLQKAYQYFNDRLFNSELPDCLLTYQRNKRTYGYFCPRKFTNGEGENIDEIALNPQYFLTQGLKELTGTLVHEQVHLWQHHFGKSGRGGYHNKQWANKMREVGLIPSDTGKPGGKDTGDRMTHYIEKGGLFETVYQELIEKGYEVQWKDRAVEGVSEFVEKGGDIEDLKTILGIEGEPETKKVYRKKYTCECGCAVWGKPNLNVVCGDCEGLYIEEE